MPFWNNSETDKLKEEIEELHQQIRNYILEKQMLVLEKKELMAELEASRKDYNGIEKALSDSLNRHLACEDRVTDCQKEIKKLEVQIEMLKRKKSHNERGAGRKSRIKQEDVLLAKQCITEGKSLAEIAGVLSEKSGKCWSRSTVKYLLDKYCKS